ncbi:hypothetical protein [Caulobacter endophyticus]|uniref:Uncharacterized protein n=1 Tax=Caulobacter endophyticus TaxID=2172652 RepID=A0A2T9K6R1_9CAUL|nr:hypothetical protein [Caulobacter endophyticus]PVM91533.1 hypothetical protein DDF67_06910 [Caulobacter endophyticus]
MKEGPIGVRRYWTIGCLAIVLTVLCVSALPETGATWIWLGRAIELVGCAILLVVARRRLGPRANLAFIGPAVGLVLVWAVLGWLLIGGPEGFSATFDAAALGASLLGLEMGALLQFLVVGFLGQGGRTKV